ncbi:Helix-turn-helix domain-containing protein [Rhizobiales bacterium GAS191]|nr:Helix-turn-helix domain-containing protein [Rhizobiales bacterium GAS191]
MSFVEIPQFQKSGPTLGIILDKTKVALSLSDRSHHACGSGIEAPKFLRIVLEIVDGFGNVLPLVVDCETSNRQSAQKREQAFPDELAPIPPLSAEHLGITELSPPTVSREVSAKEERLPVRRQRAALPKWRLKRAIDYVDTHLDEAVMLADLAKAVGLTSMHFAAQFRAATGIRPHEYVLRRRIERAQQLLLTANARLVDVALSVGFQTQAHFTTVFKRFAGTTPHQWRRDNCQVIKHADLRPDQRIRAEPNGIHYGHELA